MWSAACTCPRCLAILPLERAGRFCPRCGLIDPASAAGEDAPVDLSAYGRTYRVFERIAVGTIANVHRCRWRAGDDEIEGVIKIARDARCNGPLHAEADILRHLEAAVGAGRFSPFLPAIADGLLVDDAPAGTARRANVLQMHPAIRSVDELRTLVEVRAHYPAGLPERHVAWIWRRLLTILGFAHAQGVCHGAVLPPHVLIEPREHKLVLIDWCCGSGGDAGPLQPPRFTPAEYAAWSQRHGRPKAPASPSGDVALAARCMIELLGGDPIGGNCPPTVEPALARHFARLLARPGRRPTMGRPGSEPLAWRALSDFDRLIDALWGERRFIPLYLPPRRPALAPPSRVTA